MNKIKINKIGDDTFEVDLEGSKFIVTVKDADYERLTSGKISKEELIKKSFEFLLERESKESILKEFDITVISKYFPEYEEVISQ